MVTRRWPTAKPNLKLPLIFIATTYKQRNESTLINKTADCFNRVMDPMHPIVRANFSNFPDGTFWNRIFLYHCRHNRAESLARFLIAHSLLFLEYCE